MTFGDVKIGEKFIGNDDFEYTKISDRWALLPNYWHTFPFHPKETITPLALKVTEVENV